MSLIYIQLLNLNLLYVCIFIHFGDFLGEVSKFLDKTNWLFIITDGNVLYLGVE